MREEVEQQQHLHLQRLPGLPVAVAEASARGGGVVVAVSVAVAVAEICARDRESNDQVAVPRGFRGACVVSAWGSGVAD